MKLNYIPRPCHLCGFEFCKCLCVHPFLREMDDYRYELNRIYYSLSGVERVIKPCRYAWRVFRMIVWHKGYKRFLSKKAFTVPYADL